MTREEKDDFTTLISILNDCDIEVGNVYIEFENPRSASVGDFGFSLGGYDSGYTFSYCGEDFLRVNFEEKEIEELSKDLLDITSEAILILGVEHYKVV